MCKDIIKSIQPRISKIFHTQMSQKQRYSIRFQRHAKFFFLYSARCVSNRTGFSGKQSVCRFLLKSQTSDINVKVGGSSGAFHWGDLHMMQDFK